MGQSNVHSVDLDVALAQTPCLSIGVGPYVNQAGFASLHVHVPADVRFPLGDRILPFLVVYLRGLMTYIALAW